MHPVDKKNFDASKLPTDELDALFSKPQKSSSLISSDRNVPRLSKYNLQGADNYLHQRQLPVRETFQALDRELRAIHGKVGRMRFNSKHEPAPVEYEDGTYKHHFWGDESLTYNEYRLYSMANRGVDAVHKNTLGFYITNFLVNPGGLTPRQAIRRAKNRQKKQALNRRRAQQDGSGDVRTGEVVGEEMMVEEEEEEEGCEGQRGVRLPPEPYSEDEERVAPEPYSADEEIL